MRVVAAATLTAPGCPRDTRPSLWRRLGLASRAAVALARQLGPAGAVLWSSRVGERVEAETVRHAVVGDKRVRPLGFRASMPTAPAAAVAMDLGIEGPVECIVGPAPMLEARVRALLDQADRVLVLGGEMDHETVEGPGVGFGGLLLTRGPESLDWKGADGQAIVDLARRWESRCPS